VYDLLCCKERASEGTTEEDANLRDTKPPALSEGEEAHEKQGVYKQVEMLIFHHFRTRSIDL
jgi:hypothetical protein